MTIPFPYDQRPAGPVSTFPPLLEMTYPSPGASELVSFGGLGERVGGTVRHLANPSMLVPMVVGAFAGWYGRPYLPKKYRPHAALGGAFLAAALTYIRIRMDDAQGANEMAGPAMPTLRRGSTGTAVAQLQTLLSRALGAGGLSSAGVQGKGWGEEQSADNFGTNTDKAVRHYQKSNGLGVDGIVGRKTWGSFGLTGVGGYKSTTVPTVPRVVAQPPSAAPQAAPGAGLMTAPPPAQGAGLPGWVIPTVLGVGGLVILGVTYKIMSGGRW